MTANIRSRGQQAKPTRADITAAWARLRQSAGAGDLTAAALLIALSEGKPVFQLAGDSLAANAASIGVAVGQGIGL